MCEVARGRCNGRSCTYSSGPETVVPLSPTHGPSACTWRRYEKLIMASVLTHCRLGDAVVSRGRKTRPTSHLRSCTGMSGSCVRAPLAPVPRSRHSPHRHMHAPRGTAVPQRPLYGRTRLSRPGVWTLVLASACLPGSVAAGGLRSGSALCYQTSLHALPHMCMNGGPDWPG